MSTQMLISKMLCILEPQLLATMFSGVYSTKQFLNPPQGPKACLRTFSPLIYFLNPLAWYTFITYYGNSLFANGRLC